MAERIWEPWQKRGPASHRLRKRSLQGCRKSAVRHMLMCDNVVTSICWCVATWQHQVAAVWQRNTVPLFRHHLQTWVTCANNNRPQRGTHNRSLQEVTQARVPVRSHTVGSTAWAAIPPCPVPPWSFGPEPASEWHDGMNMKDGAGSRTNPNFYCRCFWFILLIVSFSCSLTACFWQDLYMYMLGTQSFPKLLVLGRILKRSRRAASCVCITFAGFHACGPRSWTCADACERRVGCNLSSKTSAPADNGTEAWQRTYTAFPQNKWSGKTEQSWRVTMLGQLVSLIPNSWHLPLLALPSLSPDPDSDPELTQGLISGTGQGQGGPNNTKTVHSGSHTSCSEALAKPLNDAQNFQRLLPKKMPISCWGLLEIHDTIVSLII